MTSTDAISLTDFSQVRSSGFDEDGQGLVHSRRLTLEENGYAQTPLPRADGGKDAWLFLAGCFAIEALTWGKPVWTPVASLHRLPRAFALVVALRPVVCIESRSSVELSCRFLESSLLRGLFSNPKTVWKTLDSWVLTMVQDFRFHSVSFKNTIRPILLFQKIPLASPSLVARQW